MPGHTSPRGYVAVEETHVFILIQEYYGIMKHVDLVEDEDEGEDEGDGEDEGESESEGGGEDEVEDEDKGGVNGHSSEEQVTN